MAGPIPHQQATGIHPASFVQATEPPTVALQDGTEWTDTSAGPPYVRKVWRTASSSWQVVQMDASGYPLPRGHRLEEYRVGGLADPAEPPVLSAYTISGQPSGFPAGTYTLCYTLFDLSPFLGPQTRPSPAATVSLAADQWIRACVPADLLDLHGNLPPNVEVGWYILEPVPGSSVYPGNVDGHLSGYDVPCAPLANGTNAGSPQPPALNTTGVQAVRLLAPDGTPLLTHDGSSALIFAGGILGLQAPLATLSAAPATLVGQDPTTLVPAYCPAPNPIVGAALLQQTTEQPAPAATTCTQVRCGAATALRDHLNDWYQNVRNILNAALYTLGMALGNLLVDTGTAFFVALTDGIDIELAPEVYNLLKLVLKAVPGVTGAVLQAGFALLGTSQLEWLRTKVYCHIACSANQVILTQDQMFAWHDDIAADTTILSGIQRDVCAAIVAWGANWSLSAWAQQAQTGAGLPTHDCDAYVCP